MELLTASGWSKTASVVIGPSDHAPETRAPRIRSSLGVLKDEISCFAPCDGRVELRAEVSWAIVCNLVEKVKRRVRAVERIGEHARKLRVNFSQPMPHVVPNPLESRWCVSGSLYVYVFERPRLPLRYRLTRASTTGRRMLLTVTHLMKQLPRNLTIGVTKNARMKNSGSAERLGVEVPVPPRMAFQLLLIDHSQCIARVVAKERVL